MPDGTNAQKKGRKLHQVLDGATQVFLQDGFEGASVDDIARAAGVSKATLYSYFPDKRMLFMEVARIECARQADQAMTKIDFEMPVDAVLRSVASQMIEFITSQVGKRIFRICVGESDRFPELGQEFYESGPVLFRASLMAFFEKAIARGELDIQDLELAADQFHELCKADLFPRIVFNMSDDFTDAEKQRVIDGAVEMFMARYGTT